MNFSEEQILALAPDDASRKAGRELSMPAKWLSKEFSDTAIWGTCQGSGAKPYQTQIDLGNLAFKCSCPSRKFPCKHGIGLLLLKARYPDQFSKAANPDWVTEWLSKRTEKDQKKSDKQEKPVDEVSQAKRQQARLQKVNDGIDELMLWIKDIIRNGILTIPEKQSSLFGNISRRMIDAQAPGLASMLMGLENINYFSEGWQTAFLEILLKIYLLLKGFKNIQSADRLLQEDIRTLIGFNQNQDELKSRDGVTDDWFVLSKQISEEEQLTIERNWLYGITSKQYALVLQFYVRNQVPGLTLTSGTIYHASLVYFDSSIPLRALIKENTIKQTTFQPGGLRNWKEVIDKQTNNNIRLPFSDHCPFIMEALKPVYLNNEWWLEDIENHIMPVSKKFPGVWKFLSLSGGDYNPVSIIASGNEYMPVGIWSNNKYNVF